MRVLVAVDGSDGSFAAIRQIAPLLSQDRDEVALYCHPPAVRVNAAKVNDEVLAGVRDSLAGAIFAEACKLLPPAIAAKAQTLVGEHDPRQGVLLAAEKWLADLIVVGARGLSTLERLLLGSVSRAVVHSSTIPVWVARAKGGTAAPRVLLASESPQTAAGPAAMLARFQWPATAKFSIVSVIPSIFAGRVPDWLQKQARSPDVEEMVQAWVKDHDNSLASTRSTMETFARTLPSPLADANVVVGEGEPANVILSTAANEGSKLIVLGTRTKWSLGAAIFGSTAEAVLNHAECSVLVVPHRDSP